MVRFLSLLLVIFTLNLSARELQMECLISAEKIDQKLQTVATELKEEFNGEPVVIICVLKGAFMLLSDLVKHCDFPLTVEFIKASSYGARGTQRGDLSVQEMNPLDLKGKNVLLIDDIFDSGATLSTIASKLQTHEPKKLKSLVLLQKRAQKATDYRPDYPLFEIDNHFVIGYGLDYMELYRQLPGIYVVANDAF